MLGSKPPDEVTNCANGAACVCGSNTSVPRLPDRHSGSRAHASSPATLCPDHSYPRCSHCAYCQGFRVCQSRVISLATRPQYKRKRDAPYSPRPIPAAMGVPPLPPRLSHFDTLTLPGLAACLSALVLISHAAFSFLRTYFSPASVEKRTDAPSSPGIRGHVERLGGRVSAGLDLVRVLASLALIGLFSYTDAFTEANHGIDFALVSPYVSHQSTGASTQLTLRPRSTLLCWACMGLQARPGARSPHVISSWSFWCHGLCMSIGTSGHWPHTT